FGSARVSARFRAVGRRSRPEARARPPILRGAQREGGMGPRRRPPRAHRMAMNEYYRFIKDRPDLKPRYSRELRAEEDPLRRTGKGALRQSRDDGFDLVNVITPPSKEPEQPPAKYERLEVAELCEFFAW